MTWTSKLGRVALVLALGFSAACADSETPLPTSAGSDGGVEEGKGDFFGPSSFSVAEHHCRSEFSGDCNLDVDFGSSWGAVGVRAAGATGGSLTARAYLEGSGTEGLRVRLYYSPTQVRSLSDATLLENGQVTADLTGFGAGMVIETTATVSNSIDGYVYLAVSGQPGRVTAFKVEL